MRRGVSVLFDLNVSIVLFFQNGLRQVLSKAGSGASSGLENDFAELKKVHGRSDGKHAGTVDHV